MDNNTMFNNLMETLSEVEEYEKSNISAVALKQLQTDIEGEAEKAGLQTEEDVVSLCREVRNELNEERNYIM